MEGSCGEGGSERFYSLCSPAWRRSIGSCTIRTVYAYVRFESFFSQSSSQSHLQQGVHKLAATFLSRAAVVPTARLAPFPARSYFVNRPFPSHLERCSTIMSEPVTCGRHQRPATTSNPMEDPWNIDLCRWLCKGIPVHMDLLGSLNVWCTSAAPCCDGRTHFLGCDHPVSPARSPVSAVAMGDANAKTDGLTHGRPMARH